MRPPSSSFLPWALAVAMFALCGCTKVLGDFKIGATTSPPVDAGKEVGPLDIIVTPTDGLLTTEWGERTSFTIVLKTAPRANVAIALSSSLPSEGSVSPESVTFTPVNWNAPQTVFVTGVQDEREPDGNIIYDIETSPASSGDPHFQGMDPPDVAVLNIDDETPGITVTPLTGLTTTESGGAATFTVTLNAPPQQIVTVDLSSSRPTEGRVSPSTLAFSPSNYRSPQTVTIIGVDDNDLDGPMMFQVVTAPARSSDTTYDGLNAADVQVVNVDDDTAGVTITPLGSLTTSERGLTAAFTVALNTEPSADVSIGFSSSIPKEATVSPAKLTFTPLNWRALQTVTVTGIGDGVPDGNQPYTMMTAPLESTDERYRRLDPADVDLINIDNDSASVILTPQVGLMTGEDGLAATFSVVLAALPVGEVTLDFSSSSPAEGTPNPKRITFTPLNWSAPQIITVSGLDDGAVVDGDVLYHVRGKVDGANSDPDYGALPVVDVTLVNVDNDTPGVSITPLDGFTTSESGGKASFNVALRAKPTSDVRIDLSSSNALEGSVFPASLTFTAINFGAPQRVTVTGVDDMTRDGNQRFSIVTAPAVSNDDAYRNLDGPNPTIVNLDDDMPGIAVVKSGDLTTTENGGSATFTLQLTAAPKADVAISLSTSNGAEGGIIPDIVTFTAANWSSPQTVSVVGKNDTIMDGAQSYRVIIAPASSPDSEYQGVDVEDIPVTNLDDETPSVIVAAATPLITTEVGGAATFTVALGSRPENFVTLVLLSSRTGEGTVSPSPLIFTSSNWRSPQVVTVVGADDTAIDGNQPYTILFSTTGSQDSGYNSLKPSDVAVVNLDNETPGVSVIAARGLATSENGATAQFTVALNAIPKSDVTIALRSTLPGEGTVSPSRLVFTAADWNAPQKVTVTGADDSAVDGARSYKIILDPPTGDSTYAAIDPSDVELVNFDNDAPGIQVIPPKIATTTESGAGTTFGIFLMSRPNELVKIPVSSTNPSEGTVSRTLQFTAANWATPQWVTVKGADDDAIDGDAPYRITVGPAMSTGPYAGIRGNDVLLVNLDNDVPGLAVSPAQGSTTEGGIATNFTVALHTKPTGAVSVPIVSARPTEGMPLVSSLVFTPDNWNAPQTVTVRGIDDRNVDGDQPYRVLVGPTTSTDDAYRAKKAPDVLITNLDDDGAAIRITAATDLKTSEAGGTAKFAVVLASAPTDNVSIPLVSRDPSEGTITDPSPATLVFTSSNWSVAQTVTVTGVGDAEADGNVPYAVRIQPATSNDMRYAGRTADDVMLTNIDDDSPAVTVSSAANLITTEAGGTATFRMVLNTAPTAGVTLFLHSTNPAEGTVSPVPVQFSVDDWNVPQTVTITGQQDTVVDGNQIYAIVFDLAESSDDGYKDFVVEQILVTNLDDDMAPAMSTKQRRPNARPRHEPTGNTHPPR